MTQAFGQDQTYDCLGIDVCFRDPWAMAVNAIANAFMDGSGGGACFGFSLDSLRIYSGSLEFTQGKLVDQFPHAAGANVFGIDPAIPTGGTDGSITDYLNSMQVSQLSDELLGHYVSTVASQIVKGGAASAQDVYADAHLDVREGVPPRSGSTRSTPATPRPTSTATAGRNPSKRERR